MSTEFTQHKSRMPPEKGPPQRQPKNVEKKYIRKPQPAQSAAPPPGPPPAIPQKERIVYGKSELLELFAKQELARALAFLSTADERIITEICQQPEAFLLTSLDLNNPNDEPHHSSEEDPEWLEYDPDEVFFQFGKQVER